MAPGALTGINGGLSMGTIRGGPSSAGLPNPPAGLQKTLQRQRQQQIQQQIALQQQQAAAEEQRLSAIPPALRMPPSPPDAADRPVSGGGGRLRGRLMETLAAGNRQQAAEATPLASPTNNVYAVDPPPNASSRRERPIPAVTIVTGNSAAEAADLAPSHSLAFSAKQQTLRKDSVGDADTSEDIVVGGMGTVLVPRTLPDNPTASPSGNPTLYPTHRTPTPPTSMRTFSQEHSNGRYGRQQGTLLAEEAMGQPNFGGTLEGDGVGRDTNEMAHKLRMTPMDLAKARHHTPRSAHQSQVIKAVQGGIGEDSSSANDTPSTFATSVNTNRTVNTPAAGSGTTPSEKGGGGLVSPRRGGSASARRPRSAHQDYEKYVREITGGHYLKEKYSDHIKVSTQMVLGRGSYGIVYSGVNEKTGQMVAVKHIEIDAKREILTPSGISGAPTGKDGKPSRPVSASPSHREILRASQVDECLKDVVTEIRLMAQLRHPNIVQYYHAEIVGPRWEDVHDRRHKYLTEQRRRVQRFERRVLSEKGGDAPMSPLSPLLQKDEDAPLPPMDPPHPDLTSPPSPLGRRYLVIYMEYMSGGSLGSLMTKMLGDKNVKAREAIAEQRAIAMEEQRKRDAAAGIPPPTKKEKQPPIIIPPRVVAFSEQMVRVYFRQVLDGLSYLHEHNIVHRDIKADNLLLSASDGVVRISDFGTSRKFSDVSAIGAGTEEDGGGPRALMTIIGTPHFMAPEVITKAGHGFPADIWSVGVTIIQLLTGQAPYETGGNEFAIMFKIANEPEKIQEFIPDDASVMMKDFILKCVSPEPEDRWSAQQLMTHPFLQDQDDGYYTSDDEESETDADGCDDE